MFVHDPERTVTPLYHQVYLALRQKILNGECDPKIALPGEHQLAAKYGVSRVTVRRTLEALELEGLVSRRRGIGTFPVAQAAERQERYNIGGLTGQDLNKALLACTAGDDSVSIPADRKPVVEVSFVDDFNQPLDRAGQVTPGAISMSFILD